MFFRTLMSGLILAVVLAANPALAAEPVEVLLKGHDKSIRGYLRQISDSWFLIQGDNVYYRIPGSAIVEVDGNKEIPRTVRGSGRLIFTSFYEKILPSGDVEVWSHNQITNEGVLILTGTDWVAPAREEKDLSTMEVYDAFANKLPVAIIPQMDGTFKVEVDFLVPLAPRESLGLTVKIIRKGAAHLEGDTWSYTYNVGFNEDRYLTRKIELPTGAEIEEVYSGCRGVEMRGGLLLLSQRYFPADTAEPLTVTYRLP